MNPITSLNPRRNHNHYYSIRTRFTYRFLRTLKQVNSSRYSTTAARRSVEINYAANMCMAAAVGSKRAWSRAMLSRRIRRRRNVLHAHIVRRRRRSDGHKLINKEIITGNPKKIYCAEGFGGESETKDLREIVPGGEGLDTKRLLEETAHYIKCLTTQVEVMKDILHLYSSS